MGGRGWAAGGGRPVVGRRRWAAGGGRPAVGGRRRVASCGQPAVGLSVRQSELLTILYTVGYSHEYSLTDKMLNHITCLRIDPFFPMTLERLQLYSISYHIYKKYMNL